MTEFEYIYMLNEMGGTMWSQIMNFISIIFATLVTAYFIAAKLTKPMTWTILSLYTLAIALFAGSIVTARQDYILMANTARKTLLAEGSQVPSLNMFNAMDVEIVAMTTLLYGIMLFAYVATLAFFVQARKLSVGALVGA